MQGPCCALKKRRPLKNGDFFSWFSRESKKLAFLAVYFSKMAATSDR